MVRHVEGGEASVGVAEHGLYGVVSVDSAPGAARLPHSVQDSAYVQGIVPVPQRDSVRLAAEYLGCLTAPDRVGPQPA